MFRTAAILLFFFQMVQAAAVPDLYKNVERVVYVVPSAEAARAAWARTGTPCVDRGEMRAEGSQPFRARWITCALANVYLDFLQPSGEGTVISEFLTRTGGGVLGLLYQTPSSAQYRTEIERLEAAGVKRLMESTFTVEDDSVRFAFFDTRTEGKYALGLLLLPEVETRRGSLKVTQFAFVARDPEKVSAYWEKLGFPAMTFTIPETSELQFREKPGKYSMRLGWHRYGAVPFEWIQPVSGNSSYEEHLAKYGEGFHHLAFNVPDMDEGIAQWKSWGFPSSMSGAWGEKGKPGSGRFAYHDLRACCMSEVELLWSWKPPAQ